jgi:hypothetical protein
VFTPGCRGGRARGRSPSRSVDARRSGSAGGEPLRVRAAIVFASQAVDDLAIAELDRPTLADTRKRTTNGIRPARGANGDHRGRRHSELRRSARPRELKDKLEARAAAATVNPLDSAATERDRQATVMPDPPPGERRQSRPVRCVRTRRSPSRRCIRGRCPGGHPRCNRHCHDRGYSKEVHQANTRPRSGVIGQHWPTRRSRLPIPSRNG